MASGGRGKAGKYGNYQSQRPVGGPGIFITCVRGKEAAAVNEIYDLLDEVRCCGQLGDDGLAELARCRPRIGSTRPIDWPS